MYTDGEVSAFEALLCRVGDKIIEYETERYKQQHLVAMSGWPTTDPFVYPEKVSQYLTKCAEIDVEKILCTENFLSGQFASYHVYPYYPDYLSYVTDWSPYGIDDSLAFLDEEGRLNTYLAYLTALTNHHTMPVVISEFGVSTGRGIAQKDANTGRNQGHMSESEQGYAIVECYEDIVEAGCAGCCVFSWQDEWFKRTWNTMHAIDMTRNPYWSDYQTNEQYFGLLSFDPGEDHCISYVDGDISEWTAEDILKKALRFREYFGEEGGITLSGGEPLMQAKFARELFRLCHEAGLNTCLDTSGCVLNSDVETLLAVTDRVLLDLKYVTEEKYRAHVGCGLDAPLRFLARLCELGIPTTLRQVTIPGLNDDEESLRELIRIAEAHPCVDKLELLPFRKICQVKYDNMGIEFPFADIPEADINTVKKLYEIMEEYAHTDFLRISKSGIVNVSKIAYLKPTLNGRFEATLKNGEKIIISRQYVVNLKEKLGI